MREPIDPRHGETRSVLRVVGPVVALLGLVLTVIGVANFFATMASFGSFDSFGPPKYFWCAFVGIPLVGVGVILCKVAYLGAITRYVAGEVAPVGKDVFNYTVAETKGAVRDLAAAVGEGLRSGGAAPAEATMASCPKCRADNASDAAFCKACGAPLVQKKPCPGCGEQNDAEARFCDHCGKPLA